MNTESNPKFLRTIVSLLRCELNIGNSSCGLIGAPCILFSACPVRPKHFVGCSGLMYKISKRVLQPLSLSSSCGLRQGFKNLQLKRAHDVATKFMDATPLNIHENVPGYEEEGVHRVIRYSALHHLRLLTTILYSLFKEYLKKHLPKHSIQTVQPGAKLPLA